MNLYNIGYSNIRFSSDRNNYIHRQSFRANDFPEEVFIHEFLHTLERISTEHGYDTVNLHDHEKYGYKTDNLNGLKEWYKDYMRREILDKTTNKYVGLNDKVYFMKPANENNFKYAIELDFNNEPKNLFEEIRSLLEVVVEAI